jgi:hypothetical protein
MTSLDSRFFARGPRLESVTLGPSNAWLLDPSLARVASGHWAR